MNTRRKLEISLIEKFREYKSAEEEYKNYISKNTYAVCYDNNLGKGCGNKIRIRDLDYIIVYNIEHDAYSTEYEEQDQQSICPKCGHRIRLNTWGNNLSEMRKFFRSEKREEQVITPRGEYVKYKSM